MFGVVLIFIGINLAFAFYAGWPREAKLIIQQPIRTPMFLWMTSVIAKMTAISVRTLVQITVLRTFVRKLIGIFFFFSEVVLKDANGFQLSLLGSLFTGM